MAVEIPVVVDIDKAFADAAKRVGTAMKPLQEYMDANALNIHLNISGGGKMAVKDILDNATLSAKDLKIALADIEAQINKRAASGGFNLASELKYSEKIMLQAYSALEAKINGTTDASKVMAKIYEININRTKTKVKELSAELDALTKKQNFSMKVVNGELTKRGTGKTYDKATEQIKAVNAELLQTKTYLSRLEMELGKVSVSGKGAATSFSQMKLLGSEVAESWRRGAAYIERYNASLNTANSRLGMFIKSMMQFAALNAAMRFVRNVREVTSEFEMQRVALGGIIQDTAMAEDLFNRIKAAAIKSPFEIKDLVKYTKQLSAYRIETDQLFDVTMRLADVSAGLGVSMDRLILAYGQVRAASVLRGQELRQFTEAGIPLVELLAEKFTKLNGRMVSTAEVFELISKRAVPFSMIEDIFKDMTNAGGIFYNMQEKQSETLKGQWMKLKDAVSIMYDEIGNTSTVHGAMEDLLAYAMQLMQNWRNVGKTLGIVATSMIAYRVAIINARIAQNALTAAEIAETSALQISTVGRSRAIAALFGEAAATKVQVAAGNAYVAMKTKEMMATNLFTRSLYKMIAALLANPYAIAAAGIVAIAGAIVKVVKSSREAEITIDGLNKSVNAFDKSRENSDRVERLAREYDALKTKASLNAEEQKKLTDVTRELAASFPSAIDGVSELGTAVSISTEKIRELSDAENQAVYDTLLLKMEQAEEKLAELQSKRDSYFDLIQRGPNWADKVLGWVFSVDFDKYKERLGETVDEINKWAKTYEDASLRANKFYEGKIATGPVKPEFLGDAWRSDIQEYKTTISTLDQSVRAFTDDQIRNAESLFDILEDAAKEYKKYQEQYEQYAKSYENATTERSKEQIANLRDDAKAWADMYYSLLEKYKATELIKSTRKTGSSRDSRLSDLKKDISDLANAYKKFKELREYKGEKEALIDIDQMFPSLEGWKPTFNKYIEKLQERLDEVRAKLKSSPKDKTLIDMERELQNAISNAKFDDFKEKLDAQLKRVSDELKRSEAARDFYNNILGLTGDETLAASLSLSVYGDTGKEFKDRIQDQLNAALATVSAENLSDDLKNAVKEQDFSYILANIDKFEKKWHDLIRQSANDTQKYNQTIANDYSKLLMKYDEIEQQRVDITNRAAKDIAAIEAGLALEIEGIQKNKEIEDKDSAIQKARERADSAKAAVTRESDLNLSRLERDYKLFFSSVGIISEESARRVAANQKKMLTEQFEKGEISLAKYKRELREIGEQMKKYENNTGFIMTYLSRGVEGVAEKFADMGDNLRAIAHTMVVSGGTSGIFALDDETMEYIDKVGMIMGGGAFGVDGVSGRKNIAEKLVSAVASMSENAEDFKKNMIAALDAAAGASDETSQNFSAGVAVAELWVKNIGGLIKELDGLANESNEIGEGWNKFADILMKIPTLGLSKSDGAWDRFATMNEYAMSGFDKFKSGNFVGAFADTIRSWSAMFGPNIKAINREIDAQSSLVEDLEYQYKRVEASIQKAFGSDYIANYNKQLEILEAKQAAYLQQAELERSKGKKADQEKIKGFEDQARDAGDAIMDLQSTLSEFFSGTDLTSAAKDFANAWIEAYKEYGSVTNAMKDKFNEMIQSMIENSLAAKIMQTLLQPIFDEIDSRALDGELSAADIATISDMATQQIPQINDAMVTLMNSLAAAGYNVRSKAGQFTGIARNLANASEESITGLAAGVNTQNFYMSYMPLIYNQVAEILAIMGGGTEQTAAAGATLSANNELMMMYLSALPNIDAKMASILNIMNKFEKTITDKNSATNMNVIAVRA